VVAQLALSTGKLKRLSDMPAHFAAVDIAIARLGREREVDGGGERCWQIGS